MTGNTMTRANCRIAALHSGDSPLKFPEAACCIACRKAGFMALQLTSPAGTYILATLS